MHRGPNRKCLAKPLRPRERVSADVFSETYTCRDVARSVQPVGRYKPESRQSHASSWLCCRRRDVARLPLGLAPRALSTRPVSNRVVLGEVVVSCTSVFTMHVIAARIPPTQTSRAPTTQ